MDNNRQYLFGHNVLVCPVVNPLYTTEKIVRTDPLGGGTAKTENVRLTLQ